MSLLSRFLSSFDRSLRIPIVTLSKSMRSAAFGADGAGPDVTPRWGARANCAAMCLASVVHDLFPTARLLPFYTAPHRLVRRRKKGEGSGEGRGVRPALATALASSSPRRGLAMGSRDETGKGVSLSLTASGASIPPR